MAAPPASPPPRPRLARAAAPPAARAAAPCGPGPRPRGAAAVSEDLVHLVARLARAEAVPDEDALEHADCLGDRAVLVSTDGQVAQPAGQSEGASAQLGWHALGTVHTGG